MKRLFFSVGMSILVLAVLWRGVYISKNASSSPSQIQKSVTATLSSSPTPASSPATSLSPSPPVAPTPLYGLAYPIAEFHTRMTKKFFGTYVTPTNSPVSPERFTGYHTGVDIEYTDTTTDVPVYSIADGTVVTSEYASGYGGVMVIKYSINSRTLYAIFGHLRAGSMPKNGMQVSKSEQIAVLGTGYSTETDGERRHLHFGIARANTITGYVQSTTALNATWINPLTLYPTG